MCEKYQIQLIQKSGEEKTDLEKSLYYCFEKIAKVECSPIMKSKGFSYSVKSAIMIYFDSEKGFDKTMSIYSEVSKYLDSDEIDIIMLSSENMSIFLKEGINIIKPSLNLQPRNIGGFTIASFNQAKCKIYELNYVNDQEESELIAGKYINPNN